MRIKSRAKLTQPKRINKTPHTLMDISLNIWCMWSRIHHRSTLNTKKIWAFDPVTKNKTGFLQNQDSNRTRITNGRNHASKTDGGGRSKHSARAAGSRPPNRTSLRTDRGAWPWSGEKTKVRAAAKLNPALGGGKTDPDRENCYAPGLLAAGPELSTAAGKSQSWARNGDRTGGNKPKKRAAKLWSRKISRSQNPRRAEQREKKGPGEQRDRAGKTGRQKWTPEKRRFKVRGGSSREENRTERSTQPLLTTEEKTNWVKLPVEPNKNSKAKLVRFRSSSYWSIHL
jgi:hypothetical protein